jgi:hypothetical protein
MAQCRVCGRDFDPLRFQVTMPGLGEGFDRVECAEQARALLGPAPAPVPLAAAAQPFPATAAPALAAAPLAAAAGEARRPLLVGANLALLAAGTAATVFLWFRVFGVDPSAFELSDLSAGGAPAFERSTVPAQLSSPTAFSRPETKPAPEAIVVSSRPETTPTGTGVTATIPAAPAPTPAPEGTGSRDGKTAEEKPPEAPSAPPARPVGGNEGSQAHGRSETAPHGKAKGHDKHHSTGQERAHGSGQGKKKGHDKHH